MITMDLVDIAKIVYNVNKAFCESTGDFTNVSWDDTSTETRDLAVLVIRHKMLNPRMTPEHIHNTWLVEMVRRGWRYGEMKNAEAKTHPGMCPYDMLSKDQQTKDKLVNTIIESVFD